MKTFYLNILTVLALVFSGAALADDHGDMGKGAKGKEKAAQMKDKGDEIKGRDDDAEKGDDDADESDDDDGMEGAEKEQEQEQEREMEQDREREKGDMPKGLEKKEGAPQAGKGSEKGQQMREEKSKAWWKFWGE